jgi:hypothetical protein
VGNPAGGQKGREREGVMLETNSYLEENFYPPLLEANRRYKSFLKFSIRIFVKKCLNFNQKVPPLNFADASLNISTGEMKIYLSSRNSSKFEKSS